MKTSAENIQANNFNSNEEFEQFQESTNPFQSKVKNTDQTVSNTSGKRRRILKPLYSVRLN